MKARLAHVLVKQKLFLPLLFSIYAIFGISSDTIAQGWTFSFQVDQSGPCAGVPPLPIPNLPNFGIPTKSECEAIRQTLLAIRSSYPVTDSRGNYIGECTLYVSCTPCTGSDIVIANQASSGEVSFDGQFTGEPLYSTHESSAFEDWSKDYKQQLESYGITSILGNTLTAPQIPLTGDRDFDTYYTKQTANFNPTTAPVNNPANVDGSVVDLSGKAGVVQLLRSPEDIKRENDWLQKQNIDDLKPIPKDAELDPWVLEQAPFWTSPEMVALEIAAVGFAVPFAIALVPVAAIGTSVATAELLATPVVALIAEDYKALADVLNDKTPPTTGKIFMNTGVASFTDMVFKKIDGGIGKKISNPVAKEIYEKMPGPGATIFSIWGPK